MIGLGRYWVLGLVVSVQRHGSTDILTRLNFYLQQSDLHIGQGSLLTRKQIATQLSAINSVCTTLKINQ